MGSGEPALRPPETPSCPFCGSDRVELVSPWGGQLITSTLRCRACNTHFEGLRPGFDGERERPA